MVIPLRLTSKHDRVEASPEQLFEAVTEAEKLSKLYNRELRVIGWFHSHPHITVWPSDVGEIAKQYLLKNKAVVMNRAGLG